MHRVNTSSKHFAVVLEDQLNIPSPSSHSHIILTHKCSIFHYDKLMRSIKVPSSTTNPENRSCPPYANPARPHFTIPNPPHHRHPSIHPPHHSGSYSPHYSRTIVWTKTPPPSAKNMRPLRPLPHPPLEINMFNQQSQPDPLEPLEPLQTHHLLVSSLPPQRRVSPSPVSGPWSPVPRPLSAVRGLPSAVCGLRSPVIS